RPLALPFPFFPSTPLFRSSLFICPVQLLFWRLFRGLFGPREGEARRARRWRVSTSAASGCGGGGPSSPAIVADRLAALVETRHRDRKSTRLNSSHVASSYS